MKKYWLSMSIVLFALIIFAAAMVGMRPSTERSRTRAKEAAQQAALQEIVEDNALKDRICAHPSRVFLKPWRESGELKDFYNQFKVYRLKGGKAVAWTMATNFAPKEIVEL